MGIRKKTTETIKRVWLKDGAIFVLTSEDKTLSQPLDKFPILYKATDEQRERYTICKWGDSLRWEEIDEDIHIASFFGEGYED